MDYLIQILVKDVEPNFMCAHVRCGLRFKGRQLCKAENEAKKLSELIPFCEVEESVIDKDNEVTSSSFICMGQFLSVILPFLAICQLFHSR